MPRGSSPKCPSCGRALYKTLEKGTTASLKEPYRFCRNEKCKLYGKDQFEDKENKLDEVEVNEISEKKTEEIEDNDEMFVDIKRAIMDCMHDNTFPDGL